MSGDNPTSWDMLGYDRDINWGDIPIKIVDLPNWKMVIFYDVSVPEGIYLVGTAHLGAPICPWKGRQAVRSYRERVRIDPRGCDFFVKNHSEAIRTCQDDFRSIGSEVSSKMISDKHLLSQVNEQFKTLTKIAWTLNGSRNESQTSLKSICNQMLVTQKKVQEELVWHSPIKAHSNPHFPSKYCRLLKLDATWEAGEAPFTTS